MAGQSGWLDSVTAQCTVLVERSRSSGRISEQIVSFDNSGTSSFVYKGEELHSFYQKQKREVYEYRGLTKEAAETFCAADAQNVSQWAVATSTGTFTRANYPYESHSVNATMRRENEAGAYIVTRTEVWNTVTGHTGL